MKEYIRDWLNRLKELIRYKNTLVASITVSFILIFVYYHMKHILRVIHYPPGYSTPVRFIIYGIIFFFVPLLTSPLIKDKENFGIKIGNYKRWLVDFLIAYSIMLILILIFGRSENFLRTYPLFKKAKESWRIFFIYEGSHFLYMWGWEFIFRGYLLFSIRKEVGDIPAVIIQMIPFAILHTGKPELETLSSILGGIFMGIIALRGKSFIPCVLIHFFMAFTMDLFAILYPLIK